MKLHHLILALAGLATLCGCSPKLQNLQNLQCRRELDVRIHADGREQRYFADVATIKLELQTWIHAGIDGFSIQSYIDYAPDVCISYEILVNEPERPSKVWLEYCSVNFTEGTVVVNEIRRNGSSQYVRDATEADWRFRAFILRCVAEGRFRRVESEVQAQGQEKLK